MNNEGKMQAILILAHKNVKQIIELTSVLNKKFIVYIHLDSKCNISNDDRTFLEKMKNVFFYQIFNVSWGAFSICKVELFLLEKALKNENITYFHFLSGQDWPVKKLDLIYNFYEKSNKVYMTYDFSKNIIKTGEPTILWQKYYFYYDKINRKSIYGKIYHRFSIIYQFIKQVNKFKDLNIAYEIYQGSQWMSLPKDIASYCIEYMKKDKNYYKMLETGFCSDEVMFQTILCNSIFRDRIENNNYRYINWTKKNGSYPAILDKYDFSNIQRGEYHFARKIDSNISRELINKLKIYNNSL